MLRYRQDVPKFVLLVGLLVVAATAAIVLAGGGATGSPEVPAPAVETPLATADPSDASRVDPQVARGRLGPDDRTRRRPIVVSGLVLPIEGVDLPEDLELLPNARRDYRAGWHEGIDFPAPAGTPVRAVAAGTVVRVDREYVEWDPEIERIALYEAVQLGYTPEATLDLIRGRQVWIDHGHGVVSRYAHLSSVAALAVGDAVEAGQVVGAVGSSGYPEGGPHLHLEIRLGPSYLGDGLEGDALIAAVARAFG
jgi:murein DD-endopeptidase MepM/ murein hydrolase activator NlpD